MNESETARRALAAAGYEPGPLLGSGMEGEVIDLGHELVAKVWHTRGRDDLLARQHFTEALADVAAGDPTRSVLPAVREVVEVGGRWATVERRLPGRPLRVAAGAEPGVEQGVVTEVETDCLVQALVALAAVRPHPDLAALPVLPGEAPFDPAVPFERSLAGLVARRTVASAGPLATGLPHLPALMDAVTTRLRDLEPAAPGLVHGDLVPANVLVEQTAGGLTTSGVVDVGFLTTLGDPAFDVAVTASVFDMYGPHARESERLLDEALAAAWGGRPAGCDLGPERLATYRAAYALATATAYSPLGQDGHFTWCVAMLERPEVRDVLGV